MTRVREPAVVSRRAFVGGLAALSTAGAADTSVPAVSGPTYARGDKAYEIQRQGAVWQGAKPARYPDLIVQARSEADILETLKFARTRRMPVAVKGGGHNHSATFLREGGIL